MTEFLYVDEDPRDGRMVIRWARNSQYFEEDNVDTMKPLPDLDETVNEILDSHCEVLVTDFKLGDKDDRINYNGADLVKRLRERVRDFPYFITTSYPMDAIDSDVDVASVFSKDEIAEKAAKEKVSITFFHRVRKAVDNNRKKYDKLSTRHEYLVGLSQERVLELAEREELIAIDHQLESRLVGASDGSERAKVTGLENFEDLVLKAKKLIEKVERRLGDSESAGK